MKYFIFFIMILGMAFSPVYAEPFTSPRYWKEPRTYHEPLAIDSSKEFETHVTIGQMNKCNPGPLALNFSPNKQYWFFPNEIKDSGDRISGRSEVITVNQDITVKNGKSCVDIQLKYLYPNFPPDVRWINEKLLYITLWWGRLSGAYIIYDVEKQAIVTAEYANDGRNLFEQWQESCGEKSPLKNTPECSK